MKQTVQNSDKGINIISNTKGGMGKDFHNLKKEMECYMVTLYQVDKWVEVSNIYDSSLNSILCYYLEA